MATVIYVIGIVTPNEKEYILMEDKRIPVTVLTGYLGSGKTTLLNKLLNETSDKKYYVIMNEFGEVDIDGKLVSRSKEQLIEFNNGCLCCTVRNDLIEILSGMEVDDDLDGIIIETTGLADPAPIASTFFVSEQVRTKFRLDAFITVVDAFNIKESLSDSHEADEQIGFADIIIMNKSDTISAEELDKLTNEIITLNPLATYYSTTNCNVAVENLLNTKAFSLDVKLKIDPEFLEDIPHTHDDNITSFVITHDQPIDINYFRGYISEILNQQSMQILRSKGFFYDVHSDKKMIFQSVRMLSTLEEGDSWQPGEEKRSEYVVIGRNLDKEELTKIFKRTTRKKR